MDSTNLELLKEITSTAAWNAVLGEIERRIAVEAEGLRFCTRDELVRIQERIKALEELKTLPESTVSREEGQASQ